MSPNLSTDQQFRLNRINKIRDYFVAEIKEREVMSKELSKYIAFFYLFEKSLIVLSVPNGNISIASYATITGGPIGIMSVIFSISIFTEITKRLLKKQEIKRKSIIKLLCYVEVN